MRYTEPKQRSAEPLRVTLSHMGRHAAAFNPLTFTVWYDNCPCRSFSENPRSPNSPAAFPLLIAISR